MLQGYIPNELVYVFSTSTNVQMRFDEIEPLPSVGETVTPAFAVDADCKLETAKAWASRNGTPQEDRRSNTPIKGYRTVQINLRKSTGICRI